MDKKKITLDFGSFSLEAEMFDSRVAGKFLAHLPCTVRLTRWGDELYGSFGVDLGAEQPVPDIPAGGIAYTGNGNYVCIFFGQKPAWPVEYIGQLTTGVEELGALHDCETVVIRLKEEHVP